MSRRPRVLILAENCNPEWPSLPIVGYKYARALREVADIDIVTHVRNRANIEKAGELMESVHYVDNEWIAARLYKLSKLLRGGNEVAWSTNQMMAYLPYVVFERQALQQFRSRLDAGDFDLVHRITPMSPTLPSYISGRTRQPFLIGPLNGNLDWPSAFASEQKREREGLRKLRGLYRHLPYARSTFQKAACIMAAFQHTIDDLPGHCADRIVPFPEIGFDPSVFHPGNREIPFGTGRQARFLFAGRLVPYKVPEAVVRAFVTSDKLQDSLLHIVGDGPEEPRLRQIVTDAGAEDRVIFEGRKTQTEVAEHMRRCDAFVFPSIRELGAGVVIEAMASGMVCLVTNYGAPGDLAANNRGVRINLQGMDGLMADYRAAMENCLKNPRSHQDMAARALDYAATFYDWTAKAAYTRKIYDAVLQNADLTEFTAYA